jgi:hypothetical protein
LRQEIVEAWTRVGAELESVGAGLEPAQRRSLHDRRAEEAKRGQELAEEIDVATHALITHLMAVAASPHDSLDEHDLHLVCHEEALESWLDFVLAERRYRACPTPGPSDFASLLMRVRAYWDRYGAALGRRLPGWNEPCQKAFVAERMDEFITRATR